MMIYLNKNARKKQDIKTSLISIIAEEEIQKEIVEANHSNDLIYCFLLDNVFPERMKVKEIIKFWIKWYSIDTTIDDILYTFYLSKFDNKFVKNLTISENKLLKITGALLHPSKNILLKEPIQSTDLETKDIIITLLNNQKHTKNIICLTNHTEEALLMTNNSFRISKDVLKPVEISTESKEDSTKNLEVKQIPRLTVKLNDKTMFLDPSDIDYIESRDGKVQIHVNNETYEHDATLQSMEALILPYGFYRCHRSYIINLQKVKEIISWSKNSYSIRLNYSKDSLIPISRNKINEIEEHFRIK